MNWLRRLAFRLPRAPGTFGRDRRGNVAMIFAFSLLPIVLYSYIAIDTSRLADGRAALQRAVDNAALSGASAYSLNTTAYNALAISVATASFCNVTGTLPASFTMVSSGGTAPQPCPASAPGPTVSAVIGGYQPGTTGAKASSGCTATKTVIPNTTIECGFVVTVTASATMEPSLPDVLGGSEKVTVTGIAFNPFINLTNALTASIQGSAYNTNSIWVYPVLLNAQGGPDFATDLGAIPDLKSGLYPADASPSGCASLTACGAIGAAAGINCASNPTAANCTAAAPSGCTDNPLQFVCGDFVMIADTAYTNYNNGYPPNGYSACQIGCYPNGYTGPGSTEFKNGVVVDPPAPPDVITATTPIAFAFESIAGGGSSYATGYNGGWPAGYSGTYLAQPTYNGCSYTANGNTYPNFPGNGVYTTSIQTYDNLSNNLGGTSFITPPVPPPGHPALDWPKVTHWFYSSYLANGYPPSEGEILSQTYGLLSYKPKYLGGRTLSYNTRIPLAGFNVGSFVPSLATCDQASTNTTSSGDSFDEFFVTNYPTASNPAASRANPAYSAGGDNASLYIIRQPVGQQVPTNFQTGYYGNVFLPSNTPGGNGTTNATNYAALSCQSYGNYQYTFFWNDMGGSQTFGDDQDYGNGTVTVQCNGPSFVVLIG